MVLAFRLYEHRFIVSASLSISDLWAVRGLGGPEPAMAWRLDRETLGTHLVGISVASGLFEHSAWKK